jgi:hypothetical protein
MQITRAEYEEFLNTLLRIERNVYQGVPLFSGYRSALMRDIEMMRTQINKWAVRGE